MHAKEVEAGDPYEIEASLFCIMSSRPARSCLKRKTETKQNQASKQQSTLKQNNTRQQKPKSTSQHSGTICNPELAGEIDTERSLGPAHLPV